VLQDVRDGTTASGQVNTADTTRPSDIHFVINSGARVLGKENANDQVSIQWKAVDAHQIMNYFAGKNLDLDDWWCRTL
jgi:hypothetical protein